MEGFQVAKTFQMEISPRHVLLQSRTTRKFGNLGCSRGTHGIQKTCNNSSCNLILIQRLRQVLSIDKS